MNPIRRLLVTNVRGIGEPINIDFQHPSTLNPTSLLIFGDNGSGKSSIVDALEWGLRGSLSRRTDLGAKRKREIHSFALSGPPGVAIEFHDDERMRRGGGSANLVSGISESRNQVLGFQYSPVTIRRQHIEQFWSIPDDERLDFFFDYLRLRPNYGTIRLEDARSEVPRQLKDAKSSFKKAQTEFSQITKIPVRELPRTIEECQKFRSGRLTRELGQKVSNGGHSVPSRRKKKLPWKIADACNQYQLAIRYLVKAERHAHEMQLQLEFDAEIREILKSVSDAVAKNCSVILKKSWIKSIIIEMGRSSELQIRLHLSNGRRVPPEAILSEAALDVLALAILLEVHIACAAKGQQKLIVLDDVFQSVDSVFRIRALDFVLDRIPHWQVVMTFHDRLWLEIARDAFRKHDHPFREIEVCSNGFGESPTVRGDVKNRVTELRLALETRSTPPMVCACAGQVLEELCDKLSVSLQCSVTRRIHDRYTLGDLWPSVYKAINRNGPDASRAYANEIQGLLQLRNLVGAHYNQWADSLSDAEARDFGLAVVGLYDALTCTECGTAFENLAGKEFGWRCGHAASSS